MEQDSAIVLDFIDDELLVLGRLLSKIIDVIGKNVELGISKLEIKSKLLEDELNMFEQNVIVEHERS